MQPRHKVDVWALGVLLYTLTSLEAPSKLAVQLRPHDLQLIGFTRTFPTITTFTAWLRMNMILTLEPSMNQFFHQSKAARFSSTVTGDYSTFESDVFWGWW